MRIIIFGAPGAGKGTQSKFICNSLNIPHISTGDMLRQAIIDNTELGIYAKKIMDAGDLISDEIIIKLFNERISHQDCLDGFLMDGFPRTLEQAKCIKENNINIDIVIYIDVSNNTIIKRLSGRRVHTSSGRVYHITDNPPKVPNKDDVSGEDLVHREDDKESTIIKRLNIYRHLIEDLKNFYLLNQDSTVRWVNINGEKSMEEVSWMINNEISKIK